MTDSMKLVTRLITTLLVWVIIGLILIFVSKEDVDFNKLSLLLGLGGAFTLSMIWFGEAISNGMKYGPRG